MNAIFYGYTLHSSLSMVTQVIISRCHMSLKRFTKVELSINLFLCINIFNSVEILSSQCNPYAFNTFLNDLISLEREYLI